MALSPREDEGWELIEVVPAWFECAKISKRWRPPRPTLCIPGIASDPEGHICSGHPAQATNRNGFEATD